MPQLRSTALTELLSEQHRRIERGLNLLARICARLRHGGSFDGEGIGALLAFFGDFADGVHHGLEEDVLFPWLEARGVPVDGGPLAVMRHEHEEGRRHVRALRENAAALASDPLDARATSSFVVQGEGFVVLLGRHIWKEDNILFPLADRLGAAGDARLREAAPDRTVVAGFEASLTELEHRFRSYPPPDVELPTGCGA